METIYFFRETDPKYGFLSNWYHSPFTITNSETENTYTFQNMEQYIMYCKACRFQDDDMAQRLLTTSDPRIVKKLGRQVKGYTDDGWNMSLRKALELGDEKRIEKEWDEWFGKMLIYGLYHKFTQNERMKYEMTKGSCSCAKMFAEASPYDRLWGIGIGVGQARRGDSWKGVNILGRAILRVRDMLLAQHS